MPKPGLSHGGGWPLLEKQDPRTLDYRGILGKAVSLSELPFSPVVGALQSQALTPQPCSVTQPSPVRVMRTFPSYATNAVCLERKDQDWEKAEPLTGFFPVLRVGRAPSAPFFLFHTMEITDILGARFEEAPGSMTFDGQGQDGYFQAPSLG